MHYLILLFILLFPFSVLAGSPLREHPSPYLALHADDPLQWQLWDSTVLQRAQRENKLIFISSGYFACHWCHVMQRESYRNEDIAALINQHFIPVKLDRELRPDLDSYLFDFTRRTHGIAGWPLNVFLTPDGLPLLGMVYLPAEDFLGVIEQLLARWQDDSTALRKLALEASPPVHPEPPAADQTARDALRADLEQAMFKALRQQGDFLSGGLGEGSKFPQVPLLDLLLTHYHSHPELGEWLQLTLEQMRMLGLRDHLGGGFFRYTVDPDWREPHFEKMLYDNAQLARLYLRAADRLDAPHYRPVAEQALDFMLRGMWHQRGGLIGSLSAVDGDDIEGGYYLWHPDTLNRLLSTRQMAIIDAAWDLSGSPIWDLGYLPMATHDNTALAERLELSREEIETQLSAIHQTLLRERRQREVPRDDKRLAGWNGLALSAFSLASTHPHQEPKRYHIAARALRDYLHGLWDGKQLWMMRDSQGRLRQPAGLEEHAFVASGLYQWYLASGDETSRELARKLLYQAADQFLREGLWHAAPDTLASLAQPHAVIGSGPLPSPVIELLRLQQALKEEVFAEDQLLWAAPSELLARPLAYPDYLDLMLQRQSP